MAEETTKVKKQSKIAKFFRDYRSEFKKIAWPSKDETLKMSAVVLVSIIVAGIVILILTTGASAAFNALGKLF